LYFIEGVIGDVNSGVNRNICNILRLGRDGPFQAIDASSVVQGDLNLRSLFAVIGVCSEAPDMCVTGLHGRIIRTGRNRTARQPIPTIVRHIATAPSSIVR